MFSCIDFAEGAPGLLLGRGGGSSTMGPIICVTLPTTGEDSFRFSAYGPTGRVGEASQTTRRLSLGLGPGRPLTALVGRRTSGAVEWRGELCVALSGACLVSPSVSPEIHSSRIKRLSCFNCELLVEDSTLFGKPCLITGLIGIRPENTQVQSLSCEKLA
ncbi:hypothetical protein CC79DRAFT_1328096 [Sarocladium strictum]